MLRNLFLFAAATAAVPAFAQADPSVSLASDVMVERTTVGPDGRTQVSLEEPSTVVPGDKLVFVLRYRNNGRQPAADFVVTNPLPAAVAFQGSNDGSAQLSVDGGRSWGAIGDLMVTDGDGTRRAARMEDVTHVRWTFAQPIPAGEAGRLMFRGVVR